MWAVYYSLPAVKGMLRSDLFNNYKLLIIACTMLSFNEVTTALINTAEEF